MTLTEFLEARIAEDERQAEAASVSMHGQWHSDSRDYAGYVLSSERDATAAQDQFIETWWPARVLAECVAKRAIIATAERLEQMRIDVNLWNMEYPEDALLAPLAAVYANHSDYQQEWIA